MISTQTIKVLLDFFQKIAESRGRASGRPAHGAKSPIVQSAIRRWRNPRPKAMDPAATPCGGGRWGPSFPLGVGAGIPDGPGWNAPWTRQGCRVPRTGYAFAPVQRLTLPGTARRHTQVPPYERGQTAPLRWGRVRYQTRYDIRPPSTTRDGVGTAAFGFAGGSAICGWRFRTLRVFATKGSAFGNRDLGNAPPVGKRCRRGILCQSKAQFRRHTGCMARSWAAAMAQKARRHPKTHRR